MSERVLGPCPSCGTYHERWRNQACNRQAINETDAAREAATRAMIEDAVGLCPSCGKYHEGQRNQTCNRQAERIDEMHDANGTKLNVGDRVFIPAVITQLDPGDEFCNVSLETSEGRRPDGAKERISAINTGVVVLRRRAKTAT